MNIIKRFMQNLASSLNARLSLSNWLSGPSKELALLPIGRLNLLCAQGLSFRNEPDIEACLAALAAWVRRLHAETERPLYRYVLADLRPGWADFANPIQQ